MIEKTKFLNLKVPIFINKKNGQMSISLPKKQIKGLIILGKEMPKKINIRLKLGNLTNGK